MKFNEKLLYLREKNNLSQEELAEKLNVTRQTISKWETGNSYTDMGKLVELCSIFNCNLQDLIDDGILSNKTKSKLIIRILLSTIFLAIAAIGILGYKLFSLSNDYSSTFSKLIEEKNTFDEISIMMTSNHYRSFLGERKSGFNVLNLIDLVNTNNMHLKEYNINSHADKVDWCVYLNSNVKVRQINDTNHKKIYFASYETEPENFPYTQYDKSVIDPLKYYTVITNESTSSNNNTSKIVQINITEVVDPMVND